MEGDAAAGGAAPPKQEGRAKHTSKTEEPS